MITCQAGLVPGNSGGLPGLRQMRNGDSACAVAAGDDAGEMADRAGEDRKPFRVHPDTGGT